MKNNQLPSINKKEGFSFFKKIRFQKTEDFNTKLDVSSRSIDNITSQLLKLTYDSNPNKDNKFHKRKSHLKLSNSQVLSIKRYSNYFKLNKGVYGGSARVSSKDILGKKLPSIHHIKKLTTFYPISNRKLPTQHDFQINISQESNQKNTLSRNKNKNSFDRFQSNSTQMLKEKLSSKNLSEQFDKFSNQNKDISQKVSHSSLRYNAMKLFKKFEGSVGNIHRQELMKLRSDLTDNSSQKKNDEKSIVKKHKSNFSSPIKMICMDKKDADIVNFCEHYCHLDDAEFYIRRKDIIRSYPLVKVKMKALKEEEVQVTERKNLYKNSLKMRYLAGVVNSDFLEYQKKKTMFIKDL